MEQWRDMLRSSMQKAQLVSCELQSRQLESIRKRLPDLEAEFAPLHVRSNHVQVLSSYIDQAMRPASALAEKYEQLHSLERIILSDPHEDIGAYLLAMSQIDDVLHCLSSNTVDAVQRLREAVEFVSKNQLVDNSRIQSLVKELNVADRSSPALHGGLEKIALTKLTAEFRRLLKENIAAVPIASKSAALKLVRGAEKALELPMAMGVIQKLQMIGKRMEGNVQYSEKCVSMYVEERSASVRESVMELMKSEYVNVSSVRALEGIEWRKVEEMIGQWCRDVEIVVKFVCMRERIMCEKVLGDLDLNLDWRECFGKICVSGMNTMLQFGEMFSRSEKGAEKVFKLLEMFETLHNLSPSISQIFQGCDSIAQRVRELQKQIVVATCKVFDHLCEQVLNQKTKSPPHNTTTLKLTTYVVNYINHLITDFYAPVMDQVLTIHASWMKKKTSNSHGGELRQAVLKLMECLEKALDGQRELYSEEEENMLFMMNNVYCIFKMIKGTEAGKLLGDAWLKERRSKVQQYALKYQKKSWATLLSNLSRHGLHLPSSSSSSSSNRDMIGQRMENFNAEVRRVCEKHKEYGIDDTELRDATRLAVVQNIVPAYTSFLQSYGPLIKTANFYSPDDVENLLSNLYEIL